VRIADPNVRIEAGKAAPGCRLRRPQAAICNVQFTICSLLLLAVPALSAAAEPKKVLVPFDFVSKFDNGRYGAIVGDMVWRKLAREGGFVLPETMADVRETCARNNVHPAPGTPMDRVKRIVEDDFGAQVAIWGSVERVAGHEEDVYDLTIKCVDFSAKGGPKVIYEKTARTKTVSEIPHVYVKEMLDTLYGRAPAAPAGPDLVAEANWEKNPNLLPRGDFQTGADGVPAGWEAVAGQQRERLGKLVRWVPEAGKPENKIVRFTFPAEVGDNEGVMYYSQPVRVEAGAKYRFQCRFRTTGPAVKVFIKCYDEVGTEFQRQPEDKKVHAPTKLGKADYLPKVSQLREVYRSQQNLTGATETWNTHTEDFTPRHTQFTPRWCRIMLYAYIGAGAVEFDDVVLKQIVPASPGEGLNKEPRRSQESKVTVKEMEENERRSKAGDTKQPKERR
jgi:hypothetical protein